jgi:hypothetical protein
MFLCLIAGERICCSGERRVLASTHFLPSHLPQAPLLIPAVRRPHKLAIPAIMHRLTRECPEIGAVEILGNEGCREEQ